MSTFTPANRRSLLTVTVCMWLVLGSLLVLAARKKEPAVVSAPAVSARQVALVSTTGRQPEPAPTAFKPLVPAQLTEAKQEAHISRERLAPPQLVESTPPPVVRERLAPPQLVAANQPAPMPPTPVVQVPQAEVLPAPRVEAVLPQAEELPAPRVEDASKQ